ncbi:pilin [Lysobacter soli]|uniref:pilin n=1 Tax=Lysobacter soli TaxID=453783 RepID=UPI00240ED95F|nr:pilin [Lysobacter soli]MDG2516872.1 pilin [Lysobacter soli]
MKKQQGFTLIELMIVVAIVAILAAIALPAYQDYMKRSKVSEAVATAGACKTSVAEYAAAANKLPGTLAQAGCSDEASQYVSKVDVGAKGKITVTLQGIGNGVDTKTISLEPQTSAGAAASDGDNIAGWKCTTTADPKYVPGSCRG